MGKMNMNQEMLEILIGKYLDGEITPSEQQILEAQLDRDPQAEELLRQFQSLHERCSEVVTSELLGRGKTPEEILTKAYQKHSKSTPEQQVPNSLRRIVKIGGYMRFATGVAAGLLIGLALHFVLLSNQTSQIEPTPSNIVAQNTSDGTSPDLQRASQLPVRDAGGVIRNVDWYNFTDEHGNQWLVEGLRENIVRPAVYDGQI
jgi:anti-sigma factor RsiW